MKLTKACAVVSMLLATAAPASATNFDFTSGQSSDVWVKDGITLSVSGWSASSIFTSALPFRGSAVAYGSAGYGLTNSLFDNKHTVDNSGRYDFLRLEFSKAVDLTRVSVTQFGDTDAWISFGDLATNMRSSAGWNSFLDNGANYLGGSVDRSFDVAGSNASSVWLIGGGRGTGTNDSFKVSSIDIASAVPEPATWALMIVGFGMVGSTLRRRQRVNTAVRFA